MIHPTAIINEGAQLHSSVEVGPYAVIGKNVKIGEGTHIGHHATVDGHTTMGKNNKVHPYAYVGGPTQDLKFKGGKPKLIIGDDNNFREFCTIHCGTNEEIPTRIGSHNNFLAYTHVAHECQVGSHIIMSNNATLAGHITVEDCVVIGGMTGVHQFARVGAYAMVAACSALSKDLPPFMMGQGNHATIININKVGMERNGFTQEEIEDAFRAFKIFRRGHTFENIPKYLEENLNPQGRVCQMLVKFLKGSQRGIASAGKD